MRRATLTFPSSFHAIAVVMRVKESVAMWGMVRAALLALGALVLASCVFAEDKAPDYRYRLTVEVDTPEGVKTGSSVIAVEQSLSRSTAAPAKVGVQRKVRGEAVAVDLPSGKTLFALLRSENNVDWASYVYVYLAPHEKGKPFEDQLDNVLQVTGERTLPRMWPPVGFLGERSAYPMLVTFGDLTDPTSVAEVDPDDLAASLGEGVTLKRITVELTGDPVTTGIEERLRWVRNHIGTLVYRPRNLPIGEMPPAHRLNGSDFRRTTQ
jgi:hypothetical protein